ncbi:hypothetical protein MRX96_020135 [Rhipicephalus microplus]
MLVCTYVGWIVYLGMVHEMWVYPVLEFMSPALLPIFIGCCSAAIFGVYIVGEKINHRFWPTAPVAREEVCSSDNEHED